MKGAPITEAEVIEAARLFEQERKPFKWIAFKLGRDANCLARHVWRYLSSQGR